MAAPSDNRRYEQACDQAIAMCDGNLRSTIKALIMANEFLEIELAELQAAIAAGMTAYGFTGGLAADGALAAAGAIPFARMIDLVDLLAAPRPPRVER